MIVWGGVNDTDKILKDGARYNPGAGNWAAVTLAGAPAARWSHTAVWTGDEMIIWGGPQLPATKWLTLRKTSPAADAWTAVRPPTTRLPAARLAHCGVDRRRNDHLGRIW